MKDSARFGLGYQILRISLGLSILMHGLVRIGPNFSRFMDWMMEIFGQSFLPGGLVAFAGYLIVPAEIIVGIFLVLGVFIIPVLASGSLLMLLLLFGMCLLQKWDIVGLQLNYLIIYSMLMAFSSFNEPITKLWGQLSDLKGRRNR